MTLNHEGNEIRSMAFIYIYIKTHVAIFLYQKFVYILWTIYRPSNFCQKKNTSKFIASYKGTNYPYTFHASEPQKEMREKTRGFLLTTKIELEVVPIDTSIFRRSCGTNMLLFYSKEGSINITLKMQWDKCQTIGLKPNKINIYLMKRF